MVGKRVLLACLIATFIFSGSLLADSDGWVIKQITNSGYIAASLYGSEDYDYYPDMAVSGKNIVWIELFNRIMFYDGSTARQIASSDNFFLSVQISGNNVVWQEYINETLQISFWDGNVIKQISSGTNDCYAPCVSGKNVVWLEYSNDVSAVMFWDGSTARQISEGTGSCESARISGSNVAWIQETETGRQIMFWDGSTVRQIASASYYIDLQISGTNVVWVGDGRQIILWDGQTTRQISNSNTYNGSPELSGNNVIWLDIEDDMSGFREWQQVMLWDGKSVRQLTFNLKRKGGLSISGNNIVWAEQPTDSSYRGISLIYYWDGKAAAMLTDMPGRCIPILSGSNVVFKAFDENYDYQIFSAYRHSKSDSNRNK